MSTAYAFEIACVKGVKNVRSTPCNYDPKNYEMAIFWKKGKVWTHAELLAIKASLTAAAKADAKADRIYPIKRFIDIEDKSTEATYKEYPNGMKKKIRDGKYGWKFTYVEGGLSLHTKIKSFDGLQDAYDMAFVDTKNNGLVMTSTDGMTASGFDLSMIDVPNYKQAGFSDPSEYYLEVGLENSDQLNKYPIFVPFPEDYNPLQELNGLFDLEISVHTAMTSGGLVKLKLTTGNRAIDLYDDYSAILDDATIYSASNAATGAAITVTSITAVPGTKTFNVQLDSSDTDFPATAGSLIKINIGDVSDIETAGAPGYGEAEIVTPRA